MNKERPGLAEIDNSSSGGITDNTVVTHPKEEPEISADSAYVTVGGKSIRKRKIKTIAISPYTASKSAEEEGIPGLMGWLVLRLVRLGKDDLCRVHIVLTTGEVMRFLVSAKEGEKIRRELRL